MFKLRVQYLFSVLGWGIQSHLAFREMPVASNPKASPVGCIVLNTMVGVGYISGHLLLQTVLGDGLQLQGLCLSEVIYPPDTVKESNVFYTLLQPSIHNNKTMKSKPVIRYGLGN